MKPAGFVLEHIFYPEVVVRANPEYSRESNNVQAEPQLRIHVYKLEENRYQMAMDFAKDARNDADAYELKAYVVATFLTDPDQNEELQTKVVAQSGPNIMYGALREHLATITARAPWKEHYLPAVIIDRDDFFVPSADDEQIRAQN